MKKSFILIILVSLGLIVALYSLPKIVVGDKKKATLVGSANRDMPKKPEVSKNKEASQSENHGVELSKLQQSQINQLKINFSAANAEKKIEAGQKLVASYSGFQKFDSAAFYAEKIATLDPSEKTWVTAADMYYQAFTYALDNTKAAKMGEKSREFYQKALDNNPNLLLAKTNMAMTYVTSQTPMQGILLLREVVAQSPDFEPALFNLGLLSMRSNQFSKAVERFKQITKNNPSNTKASFYLGISLARLGRNEEAKEILLKVKKNDKDQAVQEEVSQILKEID